MKIAVRGLGLVTPLGDGLETFGASLFEGKIGLGGSAIAPGLFTGEIRGFQARTYLQQKGLSGLSRAALLTASALANLRRAAAPLLEPSESLPADRIALVVGTAFGHLESKARYSEEAAREGVALVSPILFPNTIINALGGHAAILHGWRGPNSTVVAGARSGLDAVSNAIEVLSTGRADRVAAAGCDEVSRPLLEGLRKLGRIALTDPCGPDAAMPYGGGGVYPAEAAAALLLTADEGPASKAAAAPVMARLEGYGTASTVRRGLRVAVQEALELALGRASRSAADIGWLALSGSGSPELDQAEAGAVGELLGQDFPAAAIKRQCGETFGAGGLLAIAAAIASFARKEIPPTPGYGGKLFGLAPHPRPLQGPARVLVCAVDEEGASALVVAAPETL